jgi:hypothetical protein
MADDPRIVAYDERAPLNERTDARAQLEAAYRPLASQLIPSDEVQRVINYVQDQYAEADMLKARGGGIVMPNRSATGGMRSVTLDGNSISLAGGYFERPAAMGFDALRSMVEQTPILSSIVLTRVRQVSRFTQISEDGGLGFEIRHAERKHEMTLPEEGSAALLAKFFANCGWEFNPRARRKLKRDNFTKFMAKLTRDSLTMDAAPIETEMKRNANLGIDGIYALDGATIRLCTEMGYDGDDSIIAVQVVQGQIRTTYTADQIVYEVRNPRSDVNVGGYGMGETELLIRVVTGILNAMTYNINGFDKNAIPKGLLNISGDYSTEDLTAFKRQWNAMVKGINNAWSLPVLVSKDGEGKASFENFGVEFNEMYFAKWMTFLTSICCAIYGMSPEEINSESFSAQKSSLSGSDTSEKLADSKDKGLRPLMGYFESTLTDYVVSAFGEKYCFRWVGLDEKDQEQAWEGKKLILTVDELRAEQGYKPIKGTLGDVPLNPSLIGPWQQAQQAEQNPQGQQFGGAPPAEQGDYGEEDPNDQDQPGADHQDQQPDQPDTGANDGADQPVGGAPQGDFGKALSVIYSIGG